MRSSIRIWFCLAVAVLAAAVADPLIEWASNAGLFGPGNFTDHSNLDVLPALFAGTAFVALYLALRVRALLVNPGKPAPAFVRVSNDALAGSIGGLLPLTFVFQILTVFLMETTEQFAVLGHGLGGTIWLGAPILVSLALHAAACAIGAIVVAYAVRVLAATTLRIIRLVRALMAFPLRGTPSIARRCASIEYLNDSRPVLCRIGERAPPLPIA
jgi:hypothetical protein